MHLFFLFVLINKPNVFVEMERVAEMALVIYSLVCHSLIELTPGEPAHFTLARHIRFSVSS